MTEKVTSGLRRLTRHEVAAVIDLCAWPEDLSWPSKRKVVSMQRLEGMGLLARITKNGMISAWRIRFPIRAIPSYVLSDIKDKIDFVARSRADLLDVVPRAQQLSPIGAFALEAIDVETR